MEMPVIFRLAPVATLLALLALPLLGQEEKLPIAAKPVTLQAALPVAEKAFAKEGLKAGEWMLSGAVYLGDPRIFQAKPPLPSDFQSTHAFIQANKIKLPVWLFTYSRLGDHEVDTSYAAAVLIFVGPNKEAVNRACPRSGCF